jgi:hypothetical protein
MKYFYFRFISFFLSYSCVCSFCIDIPLFSFTLNKKGYVSGSVSPHLGNRFEVERIAAFGMQADGLAEKQRRNYPLRTSSNPINSAATIANAIPATMTGWGMVW